MPSKSSISLMTISAPALSKSSVLFSLAIPITNPNPPFLPASTPEVASSTTMERAGSMFMFRAALTNMSPSGFPFKPSEAETFPSTTVSNKSLIPA